MTETPDEFQRHAKERGRPAKSCVTFSSVGIMIIGKRLRVEYDHELAYVDLLVSSEQDKVAIMPVEEPGPDSYTVTEGGQISGKSLLTSFGLETPESVTDLPTEWDDDNEMWVVDVSPLRGDEQ